MKIKEQIANFFTLMNLACGFVAILFLAKGSNFNAYLYAGLLVFGGALFDFFDGFIARALGISSELGKQLDSLSDVVTFGVVPGLIAYALLINPVPEAYYPDMVIFDHPLLAYSSLIIPLFSAYRLAKFNIDDKQSKNFKGLPTPANGLLWASFVMIFLDKKIGLCQNLTLQLTKVIQDILYQQVFLVPIVIAMSVLLVAPINLMGLKFDKFSWRGNEMKFLLVIVSAVLLIALGFAAVPIILLLYILFSIIHFYILKRHEIQS